MNGDSDPTTVEGRDGDDPLSIPPRWGSESEITTVFETESSRGTASAESATDYSLDQIFRRVQATGRRPLVGVIVDILVQSCVQLTQSDQRPKGASGEVLAHGQLNPHTIRVGADGLVSIDWTPSEEPSEPEGENGEENVAELERYRSPEQLRGLPIDARTDVFSLTLTVCELVAGKRLASDRMKVIGGPGVIELASALREGKRIPVELGRAILRALARDVEQRYVDAGALLEALQELEDKLGLLAGRSETARYIGKLFTEHPSDQDSTLLPPANVPEDLRDEQPEEEVDSDPTVTMNWGSLDVFASLSKPPSAHPAAWTTASSRPGATLSAPSPSQPPPPPGASKTPAAPPPLAARPTVPSNPATPSPAPRIPSASSPASAALSASIERVALPAAGRDSSSVPAPSAASNSPSGGMPSRGRGHSMLPPRPPLVSPPPRRSRGGKAGAIAVAARADRSHHESEPPAALSRSVRPLSFKALASEVADSASRKIPWGVKTIAAAGGLLALVVLAIVLFGSSVATVVVAAAGNLGQPLGSVTTVVDGTKRCEGSRCVFELPQGMHEFSVHADGYVGQERLLFVHSGEQSAVEFRLERAVSWLKLAARQDGTEIYVDGELAGVLPNQMPQSMEVMPGSHRVRISAKHFAPEEQRIDLAPGETRILGGIALKAIIGKANFDVRTSGAELTLITDGGAEERIDPSRTLELDLSRRWVVEARRDGYATWRGQLEWNGNLEKTFPITLERASEQQTGRSSGTPTNRVARQSAVAGEGAPVRAAVASETAAAAAPGPTAEEPAVVPAPSRAEVPAGLCSLSFNSIPVSSVFLDGSRIGTTPQLRIPVRPGDHAVEFVQGDMKKRKSFRCGAGESKVVALNLAP